MAAGRCQETTVMPCGSLSSRGEGAFHFLYCPLVMGDAHQFAPLNAFNNISSYGFGHMSIEYGGGYYFSVRHSSRTSKSDISNDDGDPMQKIEEETTLLIAIE